SDVVWGREAETSMERLKAAQPMASMRVRFRGAVGRPAAERHNHTAAKTEVAVHCTTIAMPYGISQAGRFSPGPGRRGRTKPVAITASVITVSTRFRAAEGRWKVAARR